jgi:hypothetical protein
MTEDAFRAELTALALEVAKATTKHDTWAQVHDERLVKIEENQRLTNNELQNVMVEMNVVQNRCLDRGKRISAEAERIRAVEDRLRQQEDTGVHHLGEAAGAEKARQAVRKGFLFAFAILGALATASGLIYTVVQLSGCGR